MFARLPTGDGHAEETETSFNLPRVQKRSREREGEKNSWDKFSYSMDDRCSLLFFFFFREGRSTEVNFYFV